MENNYHSQAQPVVRKASTSASQTGTGTAGTPSQVHDHSSKGPLSNLA
jgi:hypothetical protein